MEDSQINLYLKAQKAYYFISKVNLFANLAETKFLSGISLTSSMRNNLLSLQQTAKLQDLTQNRLATGLKVNSAIDNPSSYYTAQSLNNRAEDLNVLLDAMSQGIQTLKAVNESIEAGTKFLEQAKSIANAALENPQDGGGEIRPLEEYISEGYTAITKDMTAAEIETLLTSGAKVVLAGDITLDRGLKVTADNIKLDGNGHKLTYAAAGVGEAVITIDGNGAGADISNLRISASGEKVIGIKAANGGKLTLDNLQGIKVSGLGAQALWYRDEALYDGKGNTEAIIKQQGANALAATAANQFYVGDKNGAFGQGNWYLPAIGELMEMYGTDTSAMTEGFGISGAIGDNKNAINKALTILKSKGVEAEALGDKYYWSSSEWGSSYSWVLNGGSGSRGSYGKLFTNYGVRCFQLLENCFSSADTTPKIGDIMYSDKTWGSADDYVRGGGKTAVGVVVGVNADGSVKIMNLKDLTFSSKGSTGNFNPDKPYGGSVSNSYWSTAYQDITAIPNYGRDELLTAAQSGGKVNITFTSSGTGGISSSIASSYTDQFNQILTQYDQLINDSWYKGVNLLKSQDLKVIFNESRTADLDIKGVDATSAGLGLGTAYWSSAAGVQKSLDQIDSAINQLRLYASEFGNYYQIVTTRENFTTSLINVLTEGADQLTLADMNQESANMLALQTRQQLAVNSLSLASRASQSVLKLF